MRAMTVAGASIVTGLLLITARAEAADARGEFKNAEGKIIGEAKLVDEGDGVRITATFNGLPPGTRAFHIHEVGKCEPPFESAGGHFNPTGKEHGKDNPRGSHAGDLSNIQASTNGRVSVEALARGVSVKKGANPLLDADGAALVVHERGDDNMSDPAGNAGKRIACAVIVRR
jgi:superoxide dismutase, Cu-Zn family